MSIQRVKLIGHLLRCPGMSQCLALRRISCLAHPCLLPLTKCRINAYIFKFNPMDKISGATKYFATSSQDEEFVEESRFLNEDHYLLPNDGHRVYVIRPEEKWAPGKDKSGRAEYKINEACALVESLPKWTVCDKEIYKIKDKRSQYIFGRGVMDDVVQKVRSSSCSAVFLDVETLSTRQLAMFQARFKVPVYDRYTVVLQIFKVRARTKEAKLQVCLAEIPYLRYHLRGMHDGTLEKQGGGLSTVGGSGETYFELRRRLLQERELKIKKILAEVKSKRQLLRQERMRREIPVMAVVGYTNAGKTSLIKALSGDSSIIPRDQLFATLDVTAHGVTLPNSMKVILMDTVGFISDTPTTLVDSFQSTLEDINIADGIIHVQDISHPDIESQIKTVQRTLEQLNLPEHLHHNIINVNNKVDLVDGVGSCDSALNTSTVTREGLPELQVRMQDLLLQSTGRIKKKIKISMHGNMLAWLHKEATIVNQQPMETDPDFMLLEVVMTEKTHGRFMKTFRKKK